MSETSLEDTVHYACVADKKVVFVLTAPFGQTDECGRQAKEFFHQ